MFICPECLEKSYEPDPYLFMRLRSRGPCEICNLYATCYEIHHSQLVFKKKIKKNKKGVKK